MKQIDEREVLAFLENTKLGVISTVDSTGRPHAAAIYFIFEHPVLYFITTTNTQKSRNIDFQNEVVLTVVDEKRQETVQIRGKAYKEAIPIHEVLTKLALKLNKDTDELATNLPVLKHKNAPKITVMIRPDEILMRRYYEEGIAEKLVTLHE